MNNPTNAVRGEYIVTLNTGAVFCATLAKRANGYPYIVKGGVHISWEEIKSIDLTAHRWEDVSFHGSVQLECAFCGGSDRDVGNMPCTKAIECRTKEEKELEAKERWEYEQLVEQDKHKAYLFEKYNH